MNQRYYVLTLLLALLFSFSCYHARIETGLPPSTQVIEKTFAASWIYGFVPPSTVAAAKECSNGVAIVETKLSVLNQLVGALTCGIYTPMHIKVTCASSSSMGFLDAPTDNVIVPFDASGKEVIDAFAQAAERTVARKHPVYIRFN